MSSQTACLAFTAQVISQIEAWELTDVKRQVSKTRCSRYLEALQRSSNTYQNKKFALCLDRFEIDPESLSDDAKTTTNNKGHTCCVKLPEPQVMCKCKTPRKGHQCHPDCWSHADLVPKHNDFECDDGTTGSCWDGNNGENEFD